MLSNFPVLISMLLLYMMILLKVIKPKIYTPLLSGEEPEICSLPLETRDLIIPLRGSHED